MLILQIGKYRIVNVKYGCLNTPAKKDLYNLRRSGPFKHQSVELRNLLEGHVSQTLVPSVLAESEETCY